MNKPALRALIRAKKQALSPSEIALRSRLLCQKVHASAVYQNAKTVYGYLPFNQEVDLRPLLEQALKEGKQVALPKCHGREMHFVLMTDLRRIRHTAFGVPEPMEDGPTARDDTALVMVPGLAFDRRGYRIGYGGGFYDRFLASEPNHPTISLCYDFQLVDQLEPEPHDIPVDLIFSR